MPKHVNKKSGKSSVVGCVVVGAAMSNDMRERDGVKAVMQGTTDVHCTTNPKQPTSSQEFSYANVVNSDLVKNNVNFQALESDIEDLTKVPVWVKLHNVPMVAFTSDGFSIIATKLGNPIMLDSYTSFMCMKYWGRGTFARSLIELDATCGLNDMLVVSVKWKINRGGNWESQDKSQGSEFNHSLPEQRMLKSAYKKKTTSTPVSNAFSALEENNGKPMDALVDDTQKKVEATPKKTPKKTDVSVRFSLETKVHYFDRDDMEFDDMGHAVEKVEHECL
ncbi:zinc knuckle CX2CX4HX4C containing protein [Tanacetum coccineum]